MKRPLLLVALFYVTGILLADLIPLRLAILLIGSGVVALLAVLWRKRRAELLSVLLLLAGWTNLTFRTAVLSPNDLRLTIGQAPALVTVRGVLRETPAQRVFVQDEKESWRTLAQLEVTTVCPNREQWQPAAGRIAILTPGILTNVFAGQTVEVFGILHVPKVAAAEGTFDYRAYLGQLGIYYQLDCEAEQDWTVVSGPAHAPLTDRFRDWARQVLARGLPIQDESLRLEWALTLGWKPALTEDVSEPFVQAATYHIFAVDGLRMAIIFGIFFGLLRAFRLPRALCGLLLIPLLWFYTGLTGWPASAIRATIMLTVVIAGWVLKRPGNLVNSLFAAALIILLWEPQQLFQAGFQLSFCVVLCLILTMPILHRLWERLWAPEPLLPDALRPRWQIVARVPLRFIADILLTSFAAWVGSIPLVALYFHIVTPVSTPANVVAVPLCGLVLMSNLGSLLLASWFPAATVLLNHSGWFFMECIRVSSQWFAAWPKAYFYVSAPTLFAGALYYSVLLAILTGWLFKPVLRIWRISALALPVGIWCFLALQQALVTRLHVVPLNGGMAVYADAPGRKNDLLVDCGNSNSVAFTTEAFLRAQGVNHLENLALTHGDVRHVGGGLLVAKQFQANHVWVSPVRFRSRVYRAVVKALTNAPGLLRAVERGDQIGPWTVLHPGPTDRFPQADDNALVLAGTFHGKRVLLLSDLGRLGQEALLEREPGLRADIVITGQPTQTEALSDQLLTTLKPELIVIADSDYPVWERANKNLCARLARGKARVIYTRSAGATIIELKGGDWKVHTLEGTK